ncbi:MAG TPA: hypothetical protein VIK89_08250 [Cytophagaceae bacterium]
MEEPKDKNKVTPLLKDENYGQEGHYYVTISHSDKTCELATYGTKKLNLTNAGKIIKEFWEVIPEHFSNVTLHNYIILPDQIHAVISIDPEEETDNKVSYHTVSNFEISFGLTVSRNNPFLIKGSVFHIINWFKAATLIEMRRLNFESFTWNSGYLDIRFPNTATRDVFNSMMTEATFLTQPVNIKQLISACQKPKE